MPIKTVSDTAAYPAVFTRAGRQRDVDAVAEICFRPLYLRYAEVGEEWNTSGQPRCDGFHYIHFVCAGGAEIRSDNGTLYFLPGQAYWLPAHAPVHAAAKGTYKHYFLAFRCEWLAGLDLFWDWNIPVCLGDWQPQKYVPQWRSGPLSLHAIWRLQCLAEHLFAESFSELDTVLRRQSDLHVKFKDVFALIDRQPDARLHISQLADAHGLSPAAFARLFNRHFGTTPKNYFNRRINQDACQLLLTTDMSASQIAMKLHFRDEYYFNRFFSKMNGISPARYRRRFRQT